MCGREREIERGSQNEVVVDAEALKTLERANFRWQAAQLVAIAAVRRGALEWGAANKQDRTKE
jgi:hypothetical protein